MAELLLELFSEEIPAGMQARAADQLREDVAALLHECGFVKEVDVGEIESFVTPRRLAAVVRNLPVRQPNVEGTRRGPRVGAPDKAVEGFANSVGLDREQLKIFKEKKGEYYFAEIHQEGKSTTEVLSEKLPDLIYGFAWQKSMRWGDRVMRWVRPLHRVVCLFNGKVVPLDVEKGVICGDITLGHRFLAPQAFAVKDFADYRDRLRAAYVMLDGAERRAVIENDTSAMAEAEGLTVKPDAALIAENAGLTEWPVVLMGGIDPDFMELPPEVLTTSMRSHQKYFALQDKDGALAPRFLLVANIIAGDGGRQIVAGNERVLRARLADAKFFWDQDCKVSLASRTPALDKIVFHAKLGNLGEKIERVQALAADIADYVPGADKDCVCSAARLAKADLTTGMVGEFPELQGIMGRYYALHDGEHAEVADAIAEHYSPLGPNDACPSAPVSVAVALADKIDTLVGFWAIDEKPTGSKDPYALRRAALGVIRLIVENGLRVPLVEVFRKAGVLCATSESGFVGDLNPQELLDFFADRLKVHLREKGVRHDLISAVFAAGHDDDLVRLLARVDALEAFLRSDDGANLLVAYRRAANIVRIEEKKDKARYEGAPDHGLFDQAEEKSLGAALDAASKGSAAALDGEDFAGAMSGLAALRSPVDAFFDNVTVNCDAPKLRENRLRLLASIRATMDAVADFSKIEG